MLIRFITITGLLVAQFCGPIAAAAQPTRREAQGTAIFKEAAGEVGLRFVTAATD